MSPTTTRPDASTAGGLTPALPLIPSLYITRRGTRLPIWPRRRRAVSPKPR